MAMQSFLIHRHGARYPLKIPEHNTVWPTESNFWNCHLGKLTPVGVVQMCNVGQFFRHRYPWVNSRNVNIFSTHRSRALESAWSLVLGLLPNTPVKFETIRSYRTCTEPICCGTDICCIHYHPKGDDIIFGQTHPSMAYKINVNSSNMLRDMVECPRVNALIDRLSQNGYFRLRRDAVTTVAKLKDIHAQLSIDAQLDIPDAGTLVGKYELSPDEVSLVRQIGNEVISRRLVPATDAIADRVYNEDQGKGIITSIKDTLLNWNHQNELHVYSCHDTNLISMMAILGIKIDCPEFAGYILIERTLETVAFYYCPTPFDTTTDFIPKVWPGISERPHFLDWTELSSGLFSVPDFMELFHVDHLTLA